MRKVGTRRIILAVLLVVILLVRFIPHAGEVYACHVYPLLSSIVSDVSSFVPFSLDEWIVIGAIGFLLALPFYCLKRGKTKGSIVSLEIETMLWIVAWFYIGWGMNYFRNDFFQRTEVMRQKADKAKFCKFLDAYTDSLNSCYLPVKEIKQDTIRAEIKRIYMLVPKKYGLCQPRDYQQPKYVCFNLLYSSVGVLGYMGPFADESHLNSQLFPVQYAYTYAHELAHLLSVSSEAEANYWAYQMCIRSNIRAVRYSGYYGLLPNVYRNARSILSHSEFKVWHKRIDKRIIAERLRQQEFWRKQYNPILADAQDLMFNMLLKGNKITDGTLNYDKVIAMILACPKI